MGPWKKRMAARAAHQRAIGEGPGQPAPQASRDTGTLAPGAPAADEATRDTGDSPRPLKGARLEQTHSQSPRAANRPWSPPLRFWPPAPAPPRETDVLRDLDEHELLALAWHVRHLGYEVDQFYRHLVDSNPDEQGELPAVYNPQALEADHLRRLLRYFWPKGALPKDTLPDLPYWTFDGEQYFLTHVVTWLITKGGMGDSWTGY